MKKESFLSRKNASEFYNELFTLLNRKDSLLKQLKKVNEELTTLKEAKEYKNYMTKKPQ